jgi:Flp pilus assembly protein TadG
MSRRRSAREDRDRGATAVEFSIVLPVVLTVIFFTLYGALFFYYSAIADHVAQTVARQASLPALGTTTDYPSAAQVTTDASNVGGPMIAKPFSVTATGGTAEGDLVTVTVVYHLPVLSQVFSWANISGSSIDTITRTVQERRQ